MASKKKKPPAPKRKPRAKVRRMAFDDLCTAVIILGLCPAPATVGEHVTKLLVGRMQARLVTREDGLYRWI